MTHHQEGGHQAPQQYEERQDREDEERTLVGTRGQTAEEQHHRVGDRESEKRLTVGLGAERLRDARCGGEAERGYREDPGEQLHAVAPEPLSEEDHECSRPAETSSP